LQPPAVDVTHEGRIALVVAEILDDAEEVADAVVGQTRLGAVGQLHQSVVDDDGDATAVDDTVAADAGAAEGGADVQLDVLREGLDLVPGAAVVVEEAEAELGEVLHEDLVEVDEDRLP